jgi:hypothetical protein
MADLSAQARASEEEYFRKKERELIEKLKRKAATEAQRKGLAEAIGLENQQILDVLQEMGFDRSTVVLLFLFPLLQVAWSDGEVSGEEQALILRAARTHGVEEGSAAYEKLTGLLRTQPAPVLFERALTVIHDLLRFQKGESRQSVSTKLIDACERVAAASGGFLGVGSKVSANENDVLRRVSAAIGEKHAAAAARVESRLKST